MNLRLSLPGKNIVRCLCVAVSFFYVSAINAQESDFKTIYDTMYADFLATPARVSNSVASILGTMSAEGSFPDLDYSNTRGVRDHPRRLNVLASAYQNPSRKYYKDPMVKAKFMMGLAFWIDTDHHAKNWWVRYIAYPRDIRMGAILMRDELKTDAVLYQKTIDYLRWAYKKNTVRHMTGANGVDIIMGAIAASVLTENHEEMVEFKNKMDELITIQNNGTGIENDFMFGQHSGRGRQLYIGNYGKEYLKSVLSYLKYCNGTVYNTDRVSLIESHFIEALQWIFYNKNYDPNQAGRMLGANNIGSFIRFGEDLVALNTPRKSELQVVLERIKGANTLHGNRHFWRFDYMIHRRPNYFTSARMTSTRTVGNEAGNGKGEKNFHAGSGVNYILYAGNEYSGDFFKKFNERQFPGTTAEQDNGKLPIPNWGRNGGSKNAFAGGASDGSYGVSGMLLERRGIYARKSWFFFDEEFVCLGSGITQTDGGFPVYSVLNQSNASGAITYSVDGETATIGDTKKLSNPNWILHGNVGYFNLDDTSDMVVATSKGIFSANIDHGINPKDKTYAYVVKPGVTSSDSAHTFSADIPVFVERNNGIIQAVRHQKLRITQAVFYQPGSLFLSTGTVIKTDQPCALLWNENTDRITVANPYCESDNPLNINITLTKGGQDFRLLFKMPNDYKAGSSVTLLLE